MRNIPATTVSTKNALSLDAPFIWLYEIEVPTTPPTRYRLTSHAESVDFGIDSAGAALTYSPFPITHSGSEESAEGDLPTVNLSISNVSRELSSIIETHDGMVGQPVTIMLTHLADLGSGSPMAKDEFTIETLELSESVIAVRLGRYDLYAVQFPNQRALRYFCRWKYKGSECGYLGALATCDKTLSGSNGCEAHGTDETAAGLPVIHPNRYGGFPGIPRNIPRA